MAARRAPSYPSPHSPAPIPEGLCQLQRGVEVTRGGALAELGEEAGGTCGGHPCFYAQACLKASASPPPAPGSRMRPSPTQNPVNQQQRKAVSGLHCARRPVPPPHSRPFLPAPMKAPKTEAAKGTQSTAFTVRFNCCAAERFKALLSHAPPPSQAALPGMIRSFEQMAAGRVMLVRVCFLLSCTCVLRHVSCPCRAARRCRLGTGALLLTHTPALPAPPLYAERRQVCDEGFEVSRPPGAAGAPEGGG